MPHITIEEAASKWDLSQDTIIKHIVNREIKGLRIDNNTIMLPDIYKPHFVKKGKRNPILEILRAVKNGEYIDEVLLWTDTETFRSIISYIIKEGYVINTGQNSFTDNRYLLITPNGEDMIKRNKLKLPITILGNIQIGFINIKR